MKITPEQIEQLYAFTRQHFVEYYDLQTELVDHLANAIEQQWLENPNVSFEDALQMEFKKFGVFGFTDLVEKRQKALRDKYIGIIWGFFVEFYKLPKIIATVVSIYLVSLPLNRYEITKENFDTVWMVLVGITFVKMLINGLKRKRRLVRFEKIWLFEEIIRNVSFANFIVLYLLHFALRTIDIFIKEIYNIPIIMSLIVVSYVIFNYIILFVIPSKAEEYLKETYPEYEMSK